MIFIKAITTDGKTELFNLDKVMTITPLHDSTTKILMGAGLYWYVLTDSIERVDCYNDLIRVIDGLEISE